MNKYDNDILKIAIPAIISNITVPLLGLVDVAVAGHLGSAAYIGAIALGGMMFNVIYWVFGFLRMGTSGMTAQAQGRNDNAETMRLLIRSLGIAFATATVFIVFQTPILLAAMTIMQPSAEVLPLASAYFRICIWGAPAMLGSFSLSGWFIGMQNSRVPMFTAITQNIVNITVSPVLVYVAGMKIEGVALGTLAAQYAGFFIILSFALKKGMLRQKMRYWLLTAWNRQAMARFFAVNRDIFLRTVCLVSVMLFFTSAGSWQSDTLLAVNTLLMQMYLLFSYIMDGFAYAGEALGGKYYGAGNRRRLFAVTKRLFVWGMIMTAVFTLAYAAGGKGFPSLLTDDDTVINAAAAFYPWAVIMPAAGMAAFIWDGVFIGCTATRGMLISMAAAAASFFAVYYLLFASMANHALWLAYITFLFMRGAVQTVISRNEIKTA